MGNCFTCVSCKYTSPPPTKVANGTKPQGPLTQEGPDVRFAVPEGVYNVRQPGEKPCFVNSAAFMPSGEIVLCDTMNKKLKLFSSKFQFISELEFPRPPQFIYSSPNLPLLYVTFPDRVRQIHIDHGEMRRTGFVKADGVCRGICVNRFDGKAISMQISDDEGQVNLMTPGGNLQVEVNKDENGENIFVRPEQMAVSPNLKVLVADKGTQSVVCLHSDGAVMFRYKGARSPSGVVCDELGNIYIAGPNSIHMLDEKGSLVKYILTKAEIGFSPECLCYNSKEKILLAAGNSARVVLFKLVYVTRHEKNVPNAVFTSVAPDHLA